METHMEPLPIKYDQNIWMENVLQHTNQSKFDKKDAHGGYIVRKMFERLKGYEACTEM